MRKFIVLIVFLNFSIYSFIRSQELGRNNYEYILPTRKVISCPSFASFRFSCQKNHVIGIDSVIFSPIANIHSSSTEQDLNSNSNCIPDWISDCIDNGQALHYAQQECSNSESCTLISYMLRSRTKCEYHNIISVLYKCVPIWEVTDVPVKCDICKNITITNIKETYGFIHSAWYPQLYPRVVCHSLLKNKPDNLIVIYSVSGSIGLDRIQIESVNENRQLVVRETLTGNLTTKLVLVSEYDVNVTVLPEDAYFNDHRRFLLYFYLIPKCHISACAPNNTIITVPPIETTTISFDVTQTSTLPNGATFAPPLVAHPNNPHKKISDAWLAAILALVYSLLMIVAVLLALYYRRRQKKRLEVQQAAMSNRSSSHIIPTISRASSSASLHRPPYINYMAAPVPQYEYNIEQAHERFSNELDDTDLRVKRYIIDQEQQNGLYSSTTNKQTNSDALCRSVEYTKSPRMERVRITNENMTDEEQDIATHVYKIDARQVPIRVAESQEFGYQSSIVSGSGAYGENEEKAFVVKLFPVDEHENEIQEMTMYVESNEQITTTTATRHS
jgi:hypothetical protein